LTGAPVLRATVTADENSNVNAVLSELRSRCEKGGMSLPAIELLTEQVREILTQLVSNGRTLAAQGSQLNVTREIEVDGCSVKLMFGSGVPRSTWHKIMNRLFGS
jgi:hypothetical protein